MKVYTVTDKSRVRTAVNGRDASKEERATNMDLGTRITAAEAATESGGNNRSKHCDGCESYNC